MYRYSPTATTKNFVLVKNNSEVWVSSEPSFTKPGYVVGNYTNREEYIQLLEMNFYKMLFELENGELIFCSPEFPVEEMVN